MIRIEKLIQKAQKGNDRAYLKLFQQYEQDIYRMAFVYVKNESDALDVVQETAYRSFKNIGNVKNPAYFKTWLLKIAIHCSLDMIRKNSKVVQLNPEMQERVSTTDGEDLPLTLTLQQLMDYLNNEEKNIVLLRFYHQYTFPEIAEVLEIPLGTAKSILYRALKKLKKEFVKGDDVNG